VRANQRPCSLVLPWLRKRARLRLRQRDSEQRLHGRWKSCLMHYSLNEQFLTTALAGVSLHSTWQQPGSVQTQILLLEVDTAGFDLSRSSLLKYLGPKQRSQTDNNENSKCHCWCLEKDEETVFSGPSACCISSPAPNLGSERINTCNLTETAVWKCNISALISFFSTATSIQSGARLRLGLCLPLRGRSQR